MWQGKTDDDTQRAFADETEGKKRIPEDTFEDPDITLKAFRDMLNEDESTTKARLPPKTWELLCGYLPVKIPQTMGPLADRTVRMKGLCGRSYTTRSSWIKPLWS